MNIYLGFDPGGIGQFGWAVCMEGQQNLEVLHTGNADHATGALLAVKECIPSTAKVIGAGIDAPLFWVTDGGRYVDKIIRNKIKELGALSPSGTVQELNSLRGSCLLQGPMIAQLLTNQFSPIKITETHPKALLFLLGLANAQKQPKEIGVNELSEYLSKFDINNSEHERDSILGAIVAKVANSRPNNWIDLVKKEKGAIVPFGYTPEYWMPINIIS